MKYWLMCFLLLIVILSFDFGIWGHDVSVNYNNTSETIKNPHSGLRTSLKYSATYVERGAIQIDSNDDFNTLGFPGSGAKSDPYVIEGFIISSSPIGKLVDISDTNVHFIIKNCVFDGASGDSEGINFGKVQNGIVTKCTIRNCQVAITIYNGSGFNEFSSNQITNSGRNEIGPAIAIFSSFHNTLSNNFLLNNHDDGIALHGSVYNAILNNTISNQEINAVKFHSNCDNNTMNGNIISNSGAAFECEAQSLYSTINWNDFINNPGIDDGVGNTFDYNYWSDWTSPDNDGDGIVDIPYTVDGSSGSQDLHPRAERQQRIPQDFVLYLPMDEGSGDIVQDQSGFGNDGEIYGATWTTGIIGNALDFHGNDYVEITPPPMLISGQLTVSAWTKIRDINMGYDNAIMCQDDGGTDRVFQLDMHEGKFVWHRMGPDVFGNDDVVANRWYHVAATFDGTTHKLYVDGVLNNQMADSMTFSSTLPVHLGQRNDGEFTMDGIIDEVLIYDRALNDDEILTLYTSLGNQISTSLTTSSIDSTDSTDSADSTDSTDSTASVITLSTPGFNVWSILVILPVLYAIRRKK